MSAAFVSASTQSLVNAAVPLPSTGYPFSFGLWAFPTQTAVSQSVWSIADNATSNNGWELTWTTTSTWQLGARAGGAVNNATSATSTVSKWQYIVGRCISSTNRRLSVLLPTGATSHAQATTARAPTSIDTESLGVRTALAPGQYFDGYAAEYWLANVDIQPDGAQLQDSLLRQLAYGGPFSVPSVRNNLVSYRSLRSVLGSTQNKPDEVWSPAPQTWVNNGTAMRGPHPPLPYWRGSPQDVVCTTTPI